MVPMYLKWLVRIILGWSATYDEYTQQDSGSDGQCPIAHLLLPLCRLSQTKETSLGDSLLFQTLTFQDLQSCRMQNRSVGRHFIGSNFEFVRTYNQEII